jgi:hypothetical protein
MCKLAIKRKTKKRGEEGEEKNERKRVVCISSKRWPLVKHPDSLPAIFWHAI